MKFVIGQWLVDPSENIITNTETEQTIKLEPRSMEVLHYFIQKPNQVISLKELIEHVWAGRIVGDHAVYRVINQIRKVLDDGNRNSYINTLPKKGYKFIAKVEAKIEPVQQDTVDTKSNNGQVQQAIGLDRESFTSSNKKLFFIAGSILLVSVSLLNKFGFFKSEMSEIKPYTHITNFVPENGIYEFPSYSKNSEYLSYGHKFDTDGKFDVHIKNIKSNESFRLTNDDFEWNKSVVSNNAEVVIAVKKDTDYCGVIVFEKQSNSNYTERELFSCVGNEYLDIDLDGEGKTLYYTHKDEENKTARIFSYLLRSGKRTQITNFLKNSAIGDHTIAVSNDNKTIAFLRNDHWEESLLCTVDIETRNEIIHEEIPGWVRSLSWAGENDLYYQTSAYSGYRVSLKDKQTVKVLTSTAKIRRSVHSPISNQVAAIKKEEQYSIWKARNQEFIDEKSSSDNAQVILLNSSVDEYPSFANNSNRIAFMSKRSGNQEIWIREDNGDLSQITNFNGDKVITDLTWSPDDRFIASSSFEGDLIYIIDVRKKEFVSIVSDQSYSNVSVPSWSVDGQSLYFSSDKAGDYDTYKVNIRSKEVVLYSENGSGYILEYADNAYVYLRQHENGLRLSGSDELIFSDIDMNKYRSIKVIDDDLFFADNKSNIYQYSLKSKELSQLSYAVSPKSSTHKISVSNDTQWIIFSDIFKSESVVLSIEE